MDVQDSIDIATLQRVALGLAFPSSPVKIDSASLHETDNPDDHRSILRSSGDALPTGQGLAAKPSSDPASSTTKRTRRPFLRRHHEIDPMASRNISTSQGPQHLSGTKSGRNMESAEVAPGDTQIVSQSVYDSIIRQNGESIYHDMSQNGADGATLLTLHEGDSGHINLLSQFGTDSHDASRKLSSEHDEESNYDPGESSPMAYQPELFPESQRFLTTTPGTAVKKNQTPGTTTRTPSVSHNPLAGDIESSGGLLALSQVFRATQAPSSPLAHGQQPELVSDRPSPNIPIQQARIGNFISSPLTTMHGLPRESSEPNLNYISLNESQTRRDKSLGERLTRSAGGIPTSDELDQEFYKESSFVENARRQRQIEEETAAQFAALKAPSRSVTGITTSPHRSGHEIHHDEEIPEAAGSEEETEQEEDPGPQVPQSQELPHSSEEDKENYNGPPVLVAATNSAHDRLSQALSFGEHAAIADQCAIISGPNSPDTGNLDLYICRSSQVMVKDSQQSPRSSLNRAETEMNAPSHPVGMEPDSVYDTGSTSPRHGYHISVGVDENFVQDYSPKKKNMHAPSRNNSDPQNTGSSANITETGPGDKSSSLPSRITETPVHLRPQIGDISRLTSIPETSPNQAQPNEWDGESNGGALNDEDDDLPPIGILLKQSLEPPCLDFHKTILSSPSGRQRRALTAIALDQSPLVDNKFGDFDLNFLTADDEEFNALVIDGSPTRPRKRRRGNLGQSFHTSDTTVPATPRAQPPKTVAPIVEPISSMKPQSPAEIHVPSTTVRKSRSGHSSRRTENIWEMEGSPQQVIRRRSRSKHGRFIEPRSSKGQQASVQKIPTKPPAWPAVVIHNPPVITSNLTGVHIPSGDTIQPESNIVNSSPVTPQASRTAGPDDQIALKQVLAVWMGQKRAYYPATCFGTPLGVSQSKFSVKFEDSLPVEVVKGAVKRFELRIGDAVKVDMRDVPKITHIVRGFDDKLTREELLDAASKGLYPQTDIYGHTTVILGPKQRKSLPHGGLNNSENVIKVPIGRIYLDTILWNQLKDRAFTYQPEIVPQENHPHTPSEKSSLPASPSARFSRSINNSGGIFANMAFAVSYKDETSKNRVSKLIQENGGSVLRDGFTDLFEPSSIHPITTPTKGTAGNQATCNSGLRLTSLAEEIGFSCLITDTHSRREKYMQALALGLPCLNGRWVEDCVAKGRVIDWAIYLLPAGESKYLNGATKSRVMLPTSPTDAHLSDTISSRPKLLGGKSVLIVTGRGKAGEKRRAYIFLTFALGAARVERVPDIETARALLESQSEASLPCSWDFVYVDDADEAAAQSILTPRPKTQKVHLIHGRKRRRSTVTMSTPSQEPPSSTARVIGNEFVCQSLILGRLYEE
ncbi:hypothetical protein N7462_003763 [Penicillium macrosclerotiorum]|uniref:uncharacterized protein n=1 Tax=Penicillium macrosclerotiorum TaxID=303699 RepID=UPI002547EF57|nr:uncharacterized protein N7462_003763 [Penicillium macrosclerotiorum]KAJ5689371.1 hypothetical protein N7462_003763 [Penicillium macrosclerotiorum]